MTGAFNHLYLRLNYLLREDLNSLSEMKSSVTALEYAVSKMLARSKPYVEQLSKFVSNHLSVGNIASTLNSIYFRSARLVLVLLTRSISKEILCFVKW
jgi:hypothetical protein